MKMNQETIERSINERDAARNCMKPVLSLRKETIRILNGVELGQIGGGCSFSSCVPTRILAVAPYGR